MIRQHLRLLGLIVVVASAGAHAADSSGTRGGGQAIDINGKPSLRDLVERTVCRWTTGTAVRNSLPEFQTILQKLERVHWYYARRLAHAASELHVCMTEGSLSRINSQDQDGITIGEVQGDQVAIRWGSKVYIDKKIFSRMNAKNQAYLFFHEVMHSFIPVDEQQRNIKLRSFVKATEDFAEGRLSREQFLEQIPEDSVNWPTRIDAEALEPLRSQLTQFFADDLDTQMTGAVALGTWGQRLQSRGALTWEDAERIDHLVGEARDDLFFAIRQCQPARVKTLVEKIKIPMQVTEEDRTQLLLRSDLFVSVVDVSDRSRNPILVHLVAKSNANMELGIQDEACVETARYLRSLPNLRVGTVVQSLHVRPHSRFGSVMVIRNPELVALFLGDAVAMVEAQDAKDRAKRTEILHRCATNAEASADLLKDIHKEIHKDPNSVDSDSAHLNCYPIGGDSTFDAPRSELKAVAAELMASPGFDRKAVGRRLRKELPDWERLGQ